MVFSFRRLLYPPLCCHCQVLLADPTRSLCACCAEEIALEPLEGRCLTCFRRLESPPCPVCSKRSTRIVRQIAALEAFGPGLTLLYCANRGDHTALAPIAALMAYQWARHQMPIPDLVIPLPLQGRGDPHVALAEHVARLLGSFTQRPLVKRWDFHLFMTTGRIEPRFMLRRSLAKGLVDKTVLIVSLRLDDTRLQQAARALETAFPRQIYALALAAAAYED